MGFLTLEVNKLHNAYFTRLVELHKNYCIATGLKSIIINADNNIISEYSNSDTNIFCSRFLPINEKKNCICNKCECKELNISTTEIHNDCQFPFWSCNVPIKIENETVAKIFVGEVLKYVPNKKECMVIAKKSGIDSDKIVQNINKILIFTEKQKDATLNFLKNVSNLIMHHYYETQKYENQVDVLKVIDKIGKSINSKSSRNEIFETIDIGATDTGSSKFIQYDTFCILLLNHEKEEFEAVYASGTGKHILDKSTFGIGEGYAGWVLKENKELIVEDATTNLPIPLKYPALLDEGLRSFLVVPLQIENKRIGCFIIASKQTNKYSANITELLNSLACWAAIAINKYDLISRREKMLYKKEDILGEYIPQTLHHYFKSPIGIFKNEYPKNFSEKQTELFQRGVELFDEVITNARYYLAIDEYENFAPVFQLVNVLDILNHVKNERVKEHIKAKNVKIDIITESCNRSNTYVWADYNQLRSVFINLLSNAIKFGNNNNVIRIILKENEEFLTINIIDQGNKICDADIENIFLPFKRGPNSNGVAGGGLGLFITKKIIAAHKWPPPKFEINQDKGCTISIQLPYQCPLEILILDNSESYLKELKSYLNEIKCEVTTILTIPEAEIHIDNAQRSNRNIKLVILGETGDKKGLAAAKKWKKENGFEIILMSGRTSLIKKDFKGFSFITKPFDKKYFIEVVKTKLKQI